MKLKIYAAFKHDGQTVKMLCNDDFIVVRRTHTMGTVEQVRYPITVENRFDVFNSAKVDFARYVKLVLLSD